MTRRHRHLALLLACGALAAGCGGAAHHGGKVTPTTLGSSSLRSGLIVGLADGAAGWGGSTTAPRLNSILATTGAKWVRDPFNWSTIEPAPGRFSFAYYDHYMLAIGRRHMHVLAQLIDAPAWAAPTPETVPRDPGPFARYVAAVVGRYGPHGSFWRAHPSLSGSAITVYEVWNEPYFAGGNDGSYDPGSYARLIKAAGAAGHAVAPSARFLLEAEMVSHLDRVWTWWVDALYQAVPGLNRYFDGVAVHDFGSDTQTLNPIVYGKPYGNFGHIRRIEDLRRQFLAHGAGSKPFWITEAGWSTCTQHSIDCVSDARQASNFTTLFSDLSTRWKRWVQAVFIYRFKDGLEPQTVQGGYGVVTLAGRPKPALHLFRSFAARA